MKLVVHNIGPLEHFEAEPDGHNLLLKGPNESGKSTVLNLVKTIARGKEFLPSEPVRKGAKNGKFSSRIEHDGIAYIVEIGVGIKGTHSLKVYREDDPTKECIEKPQTFLTAMFGDKISYDIDAWLKSEKARADYCVKLLKVDPREYEKRIDSIAQERTIIGRTVAQLKGELAGKTKYPGVPDTEVDIKAIAKEVEDAALAASRHEIRVATITSVKQAIETATREREALVVRWNKVNPTYATTKQEIENEFQKEIERLKAEHAQRLAALETRRLTELEESQRLVDAKADAIKEKTAALAALEKARSEAGKPPDVEEIRARLGEAEITNRKVRANKEHEAVGKTLLAAERSYEQATAKIEAIKEEKEKALIAAKLPIEGLTFDETGVRFEGLPIEQISQGRGQEIALAIACELNPGGVVVMSEELAMDRAHFERAKARAAEKNVQLLVELRTWEDGPLEIVIEMAPEESPVEEGATA